MPYGWRFLITVYYSTGDSLFLEKQYYHSWKGTDLARASLISSTTKLILDLFLCATFQFLFPIYFLSKPIISNIHVPEGKTELTFIHLLQNKWGS